jgi:hypothetical protein
VFIQIRGEILAFWEKPCEDLIPSVEVTLWFKSHMIWWPIAQDPWLGRLKSRSALFCSVLFCSDRDLSYSEGWLSYSVVSLLFSDSNLICTQLVSRAQLFFGLQYFSVSDLLGTQLFCETQLFPDSDCSSTQLFYGDSVILRFCLVQYSVILC